MNTSKELQTINRYFHLITQASVDIIFLIDTKGKLVFVSHSIKTMLGYNEKEIIGVSYLYLFKGEQKIKAQENFEIVLKGNVIQEFSTQIYHKNKTLVDVIISGQLTTYKNKTFIQGSIKDITKLKKAELKIKEQANQYKDLIEIDGNGIIIYQGDKIVYANHMVCEMTGYTKEEILEKTFWEMAVEKEAIREKGYKRLRGELQEDHYEIEILHKKGHTLWIDYTAKVTTWNHKPAVIISAFDLTRQKEIENALIESEQRYKTLADMSDEAIFLSYNGVGIDCNKKAEEMFGYTKQEIIGLKGTEIVADEYKDLVLQQVKSKYSEPYEVVGKKKNGELFPIEIRGTQIIYQKRKVRVTKIRDISRQKEMEYNLRMSEAKYRTLTESLSDCVFTVDVNGVFTYLNSSFETITKYKVEEYIGRHFLDGVAKEYHERMIQMFTDGLKSNSSLLYEIEIIDKNKRRIPVEISVNTLFDEDGKAIGRIGTFRDISKRKQTQKALLAAKQKAEESSMLKTAFLQNMSHEIRTPLNGILGFADLLKESDLQKEDIHAYADIISDSGNHLLKLINNILDISKIEAKRLPLNMESFSLNRLFDDIKNMVLLKVAEKGLVLKMEYGLEDEESFIVSDKNKLRQILINLINNAIKFTFDGKIVCRYRIEKTQIHFYVKDTGIGIDKEYQKKIFERFYQTDFSKSREYEGAGLGLAITKGLVGLLGGAIDLKSQKGKGSTFHFTIPYKKAKSLILKKKKQAIRQLSEEEISILIAEDDNSSYLFLKAVLSSFNVKLFRVVTGKEAIAFCEKQLPDLILMDISMPKMDGLEATRIIKQKYPTLPIIAQSAFAFSIEQQDALDAGCDEFIAKPIVKNELLRKIKQVLDRKKGLS